MIRYTIITLFIFTIFFSGCSKKQVDTPQNNTTQISNQSESFEDELLGEFESELEVKEEFDPFSGYNRIVTSFNDGVYVYFLLPVSTGYKKVTNENVRESVGNFFENLLFPIRFVNNVLQGKFSNATQEVGRFMINTTFGVLGLFDPAEKEFNLQAHKEDFGQTLGYWGLGSGPHIVLPFFGPSNLRDLLGFYPDSLLNPIDYYASRDYNVFNTKLESLGGKISQKINETATQDQYGILKKDAIDLYPYLKNTYEQYRLQQIKE